MHRRILLFILISFFSAGHILAQQSLSVTTNALGSPGPGADKYYYASRNDPPRAIEFKERAVVSSYFLANINRYLDLAAEFTFEEAESNTDHLGMKHRLLLQYYKGIPLEGMGYRVHERDGYITSANGKAVKNIKLDVQTAISEEQAFHLAVKHLNSRDSIFRPARKLIVSKGFSFTPGSFSVAFQFDIDVSLIEHWRISIDAVTGDVINKVSLVNTCIGDEPPLPYGTGTGTTNYYGIQDIKVEKFENSPASRLRGETEHGGRIETYDFRNVSILSLLLFFEWHKVYDFYSSNNTYNDPYDKPAVSVQWAAEQAYEYYYKKHNRNSFDNNGSTITSYVHVDRNLNGAYWTHNLLAFGDGNNNNPLVELDVVSHELTHGVTQYEAQLQYYYEPGALNESFSDILGKAVEFTTFGDSATWQLAKHYREGGLRDFSNPNLKNQPDTYAGEMWYTGYEDNGGVHINSGVQNFWFYLLCEGGSGVNDHQASYSVKAIGMDTAVNIVYRNLTEYLSYNSDYLDSRIGSLLATADLYGKNSRAYQEVENAWDAVGVIKQPIITSLEVFDITATTVKIKGSLLPRGDTVTYHFEYGTTPAFGNASSIYKYDGTVEGIITGLQSETKYYLRLVATNEHGNSYAATEFTTISLAPLVKIRETVDVTETTAVLYGEINPNSLPTSFYFEYGLTPALGMVTPTYPLSDTTEFLPVSASVTGLQPRKTYYYKLTAINDFASSSTGSKNFFTAVKPIISSFTPATAPLDTEITIIGQNFNPVAEKNKVSFGATRGIVLSSSSTEIKIKVPAGASHGPIALLDAESGLLAESVLEFVPTFTDEFRKGDLQLRVGSTDYIYQALVHDMDGDGKPDIVALHYMGFSVFQNVNQGGDITDESFVRNIFNSENTPGTLSLVDFDGNGLMDIVGRYRDVVRIHPNLSVPGYIFFGAPVDLPIGNFDHMVFNDFDQDGRVDIGCTTFVSLDNSLFTIIRNQNPKGSLSADNFEQRYTKALPYAAYFLTTNDINNDGTPDLIASAYFKDFLSILENNSHPGAFEFQENVLPDSTRGRFVRHVASDLNQDGWKDIASLSSTPYESSRTANLTILENGKSPDVTLRKPVVALNGATENTIQPGDINGDGKVDLLVGLNDRTFKFLQNKAGVNEHLTDSSFEKFDEYGFAITNAGSGTVESQMIINDLNGDGRPEIIRANSYSYGPHDGYSMEIWQNAPNNCPDPLLIAIEVSNTTATIILPPNTTLEQFEIEYAPADANYWWQATSTTLDYLTPGRSYQLRVRGKCYLGFTVYHYINFTTDCVNTNSFSISQIGVDYVTLQAYNLYSFEVQYSQAGKGQWETLPQYSSQITNLLPGTTYDLRLRGRCFVPGEFKYQQFTTLCPKLSTLTINNVTYNKAEVSSTSNYTGNAIFEYSADNVAWTLVDQTRTMFPLIPGNRYFVRGRLACTDTDSDFITTSFVTPCPKVSKLHIDSVTPFSARVNWLDESNTNSYILTYSMTTGGHVTTVETSSLLFDLEGLSPGTQYTITVAPQCSGTKDFSSATFSTVCYVPVNLSVNNITHTTAELTWSDNFGGLPYDVDYAIAGSNVWLTTETALTNLLLTALRPGTEYEVRVHINCPDATEPYASLRFATGLYNETAFSPNPTTRGITIHPSKNLIGSRFSIYDSTGKMLADGELLNYTIDLSDFSPGIHVLKIEGEKPMKIVKR